MRYFWSKRVGALFISGLFLLSSVLSVRADESLSVSGSIPPQATDFQINASNDTISTVAQNQIVTYTIRYGTPHLYYADRITVEAYWSQGTISGASSPSVDPMTYISGSAGKAYNNTSPVVDLSNNKISWTISSLPAQTSDQTVTFQLRTNSSYTGSSTVNFPVKTRLIATNYTTDYQANSITYAYDASQVTPTPTPGPTTVPTSGPTNTPTPGPTISGTTPTPTTVPLPTAKPTQSVPTFNNISILNLTSSTADIGYIVTKNGTVSFSYGTSPTNLGNTQASSNPGYGIFTVSNLIPQQKYYFQLSLGSESSEIFSFTTPIVSQIPQVVKTSLVIAGDNGVLYSANLQNNGQNVAAAIEKIPNVAIAPTSSYSLSFKLTKTKDIKAVQVLLQNANVLGLATTAFAQELQQYPYIYAAANTGNGVYTANIANTLPPGNYNMFLAVRDAQGNITTEQVANIHVLHPFQAINVKTKKPIEDVRITLYRLVSGQYSIVADLGSKNPLYTNAQGNAQEQLTTGKYKAVFTYLGYESVTKYFSIGINPNDDYPTAEMTQKPITLARIFMYYANAFIDWRAVNAQYYDNLRASYRFFDLIGLLVIFCSIVVCYLLFSVKTHIRLSHVLWYVHHHGLKILGKGETPYITGKVMEHVTGQAVDRAKIFIFNGNKQLIKEVETSRNGTFLFPKQQHMSYFISVMKEGFRPIDELAYEQDMTITLEQIKEGINILRSPFTIFKDALGLAFEFILVFTIIMGGVFFSSFPLIRTLPFDIATVANVFLWFVYIREKKR